MVKRTTSKRRNTRDKRLSADAELERLRDLLSKKRDFIAILELELFNTRADLAPWMKRLDEHIAPFEKRLRDLRMLLFQTMEAMQDDFDEDMEGFGLEDEEEFTYQDRIDPDEFPSNGNGTKKLSPKLEEKVRKLFRELAKRFHPDLTADPEEKKWREEVMSKINMAYSKRDLKELEALAEQPDRALDAKKLSREEEIKTIKKELKRLDGVINELKSTIHWLEDSPARKLKLQVRNGRNESDVLAEIEVEYKMQIEELEKHLSSLGADIETVPDHDTTPQT